LVNIQHWRTKWISENSILEVNLSRSLFRKASKEWRTKEEISHEIWACCTSERIPSVESLIQSINSLFLGSLLLLLLLLSLLLLRWCLLSLLLGISLRSTKVLTYRLSIDVRSRPIVNVKSIVSLWVSIKHDPILLICPSFFLIYCIFRSISISLGRPLLNNFTKSLITHITD